MVKESATLVSIKKFPRSLAYSTSESWDWRGRIKVYAITTTIFTFLFAAGAANVETYVFATYMRLIFLAISAALSFVVFVGNGTRVSKRATYIFLFILIFTILYFPLENLPEEFVKSISFSYGAIIVAYITSATNLSRKSQICDLAIALIIMYVAYLVYFSTLTFDSYIPTIRFSPIPGLSEPGDNVTYSQGITRIFAVGVIAAIFKLTQPNTSIYYVIFLVALALSFFILSLAGGARGEVIVCLATVILIVSRRWKFRIAAYFVLIVSILLLSAIAENLEIFMKLPSIARLFYSYEFSDLGGRDFLLNEALFLLAKEPQCAILGCGFMYFQEYNGFDYGEYPHNWIVEFLITFGVILLILSIVLFSLYVYRNYNSFSANERFLLFLTVYFFGVSLKSGQVPGEALLYSCMFPVLFSIRRPSHVLADTAKDLRFRTQSQ